MGSEWIIVAVIGVILLFSAKKLPDMARGLGQSMRIFKAETKSLREDGEKGGTTAAVEGSAAPGRSAGDGTPSGSTASGSTAGGAAGSTPGGSTGSTAGGSTAAGAETPRPADPGDGSRSTGSGA